MNDETNKAACSFIESNIAIAFSKYSIPFL